MAKETIRALNVEINLSDKNFSQNITNINKQVKNLDNEFKVFSQGFGNVEKSFVGLSTKMDVLNKSIDLQKTKLGELTKQESLAQAELDRYSGRLESNKNSLASLQAERAKAVQLYGEESAEVRKLDADIEALQKEYEQNGKQVNRWTNELQKAQTGIDATTNWIDNLEKQLQETSNALKTFHIDAFIEKLETTGKNIQNVGDKFTTFGRNVASVGKDISTAITVPLIAMGGASVKLALDYETSLAKLGTIAETFEKTGDKNHQTLNQMGDAAIQFSNETGIAVSDVNESLYQAISASVDTADAVEFLGIANKAAKGGFTDLGTAVDGLSTIMNIYGLDMNEVDTVANQMLVTQNKGKTTFGELAQVLGTVAPIANQLGIETDQLLSSFAALTANGIETNKATTGLKAAFANLTKPTAQATKLAESLGIKFDSSTIQTKGWQGTLEYLNDAIRKSVPEYANLQDKINKTSLEMQEMEKAGKANSEEYKKLQSDLEAFQNEIGNISGIDKYAQLFGSIEGLNSMMVLTSEGGMQLFNDTMKEMETNTTALDDAYKAMTETTGHKITTALNTIKNAMVQMGAVVLPVIAEVAEKIAEWTKKFQELSPTTKKFIIIGGLILAAIGPIIVILGTLISSFGIVTKAVGGSVLGFGKLVKGGKGLFTMFSKTKGAASAAGKAVAGMGDSVSKGTSAFSKAGKGIGGFSDPVKTLVIGGVLMVFITQIDNIIDAIGRLVKTIGDFIVQVSTVDISNFLAIMDSFMEVFKIAVGPVTILFTAIQEAVKYIGEALQVLVQGIVDLVLVVVNNLATIIEAIGNAFATVYTAIYTGIETVIRTIGESMALVFSTITDGITNVINSIGTNITNIINSIHNLITGVASTISDGIVNIIDSVNNLVTGVIDSVSNGIIGVIDSVSNGINTVMTSVSEGIALINESFFGGIQGIIEEIGNSFLKVGEAMKLAGEGGESAKAAFEGLASLNIGDILTLMGIAPNLTKIATAFKDIASATGAGVVLSSLMVLQGSVDSIASGVSGVANGFKELAKVSLESLKSSLSSISKELVKIAGTKLNTVITGLTKGKDEANTFNKNLINVNTELRKVASTSIANISTQLGSANTSANSLKTSLSSLNSVSLSTVLNNINSISTRATTAKTSATNLRTALVNAGSLTLSTVKSALDSINTKAYNARVSVNNLKASLDAINGKKYSTTLTVTQKTQQQALSVQAIGEGSLLENSRQIFNPMQYLLSGDFYNPSKDLKNSARNEEKMIDLLSKLVDQERKQVINIDNINLANAKDETQTLNRLRFFAHV